MTQRKEPGVALYRQVAQDLLARGERAGVGPGGRVEARRQVAQDLLARVERSELAPGERLEPEARLAERYGVNRLTVRRALEELARAGIVRTEHGVGSFIAEPAVRHRIDDGEASLSESMARRGIAVRHRVLAVAEVE